MSITTLIVDDSIVYRQILSDVIANIKGIVVAGVAANGSIAVKKLAHTSVDLVLLDVQMPEMDGIQTLAYIRQHFPRITVVMVSGCTKEATTITMQALNMGALEFINKPTGDDIEQNKRQIASELQSVIRIIETRNLLHGKSPRLPAPPPPLHIERSQHFFAEKPKLFSIVVIGISTGGPNALITVLRNLKANFPLPILVVQHMPPNFTAALADDLNKKSELRIVEAQEDMAITPGTVFLAQGGHHMVVRMVNNKPVIGLNDGPPENSCRPAVDVLFRSVASAYADKGILSIIMTGMGSDGLAGIRALKRKGCYCITQSAETCVVYGMPRSIDEAGLSDESVALDNLAKRITDLVVGHHVLLL